MSGDCQKKQEIKNTAKKSTSPENVNKKERNFAKQTFFGNALAIHENVVDTKKEEINMGYEILATPFGKLEITAEPWLETRTMTFEKNVLTIFGGNVSRLTYKLCQITRLIYTARPFEKYLLGKPHSFVRENIPEMADRVNRGKAFFAFGGFQITLSHLAATWVIEATPSYNMGTRSLLNLNLLVKLLRTIHGLSKVIPARI